MNQSQLLIDVRIAQVWLDEEDIIRIDFKDTEHHHIEDAREIVAAHNEISNGAKKAVLADIRDVTTGANREARRYYVTPEASEYKLAMAMLVRSPLQRMLGNVFFFINHPPYPSRLFGDPDQAKQWLKEFQS